MKQSSFFPLQPLWGTIVEHFLQDSANILTIYILHHSRRLNANSISKTETQIDLTACFAL